MKTRKKGVDAAMTPSVKMARPVLTKSCPCTLASLTRCIHDLVPLTMLKVRAMTSSTR